MMKLTARALNLFVASLVLALLSGPNASPTLAQTGRNPDQSLGEAANQYQKGVELYKAGRFTEALGAFVRVIELEPNSAVAYSNLGSLYIDLGKYEEAIEVLEYAHSLDPKLASALNNLGNAYGRSGMPQRAIDAFQAALRLNPTSALTHANLGAQYYLLRRYQEAAETLDQAIRLDANLAEAYYLLGRIYLTRRERRATLAQYTKLKACSPALAQKLYAEIFKGKVLDVSEKTRPQQK